MDLFQKLYIRSVRRLIRTYLSLILLLSLAIQFAPLSLMHSHDDHGHVEIVQKTISSHDADENGSEHVSDANESSEDDCTICEIQQSLNNQAYTLSKQTAVSNFGVYIPEYSDVEVLSENYLIESISGRAPPRA